MSRPPGWEPDPRHQHLQRWWDGAAWTADVVDEDPRPVPAGTTPPPTVGWHPDPTGRFRTRFADGATWTARVAFREADAAPAAPRTPPPPRPPTRPPAPAAPPVRPAARPAPRSGGYPPPGGPAAVDRTELAALAYTREFLADARRRGDIDLPTYARLTRRVADTRGRILAGEPAQPAAAPAPAHAAAAPPVPPITAPPVPPITAPPVPPITAPPVPPPSARRAPSTTPVPPSVAPPPIPPPGRPVPAPTPAPWVVVTRAWLHDAFRTVRSDLALHGLAYLGVLLLFAGVFGFVAFTFGEVNRTLRPAAEVAIPAAAFLASWFLRRRGAPYVAAALELLGGAVLPIVAFASLVDGSDVPADLTGGALELALTLIAVVIAGAYALTVRRRPSSPLRFLAAPVLWLGVMAALLATDPTLHGGEEITRLLPWQTAATIAAIAVSALVARRFRGRPLGDATDLVVIPGALVVTVLQVLASAREDWPVGPTVLAALALLVIVELQDHRLGVDLTAALQGAVLAGSLVMLSPHVDVAWLGAAGAVGFLALAEWEGHRRPTTRTIVLLLAAATAGAALALDAGWSAVTAFTAATAWAHLRRRRPRPWVPAADRLPLVAAVLPVGVAVGLFTALAPVPAAAAVAGATLALVVATRFRGADDPFWTRWNPVATTVALAAVVGATVAAAADARPGPGGELPDASDLRVLAAATLAVALAYLACRTPGPVRVWTVAPTTAFAAWLALAGTDLDPTGAAVGVAVIGLALVLVAVVRRLPVAGDLGLVGHTLALGAVAVSVSTGTGVPVTVTIAGLALGWLTTTVAQERTGSTVVDRLTVYAVAVGDGIGDTVAVWVAPIALYASATAAVAQAGVEHADSTRALALAITAVVFAASARLTPAWPRVATVGAWATGLVALGALPVESDVVGTVTAVAAVVSVVVVPGARRAAPIAWVGWFASALVVARGAFALGLPESDVQVALFAWGAVASILVLVLHRWRPDDPARAIPRAVVPFVAAAAALVYATTTAWTEGPGAFGWWSLALGGVVAAWAVVTSAPWLTVVAFALGADAGARLLPWPLPQQAWNLAVVVAATTSIAAALHRWTAPRRAAGSDLPVGWAVWPFVVANGTAAAMVLVAEATADPAATYLVVAAWALVVATVTRWWPWAAAGAVLLNVGAGRAGAGWLAATLLVTAGAATVAAIRTRPPVRWALQVIGAAALGGAWVSAAWWLDVGMTPGITAGAVTAGTVTFVAAVALRLRREALDWSTTWGGVGIASVGAAGVLAESLGTRAAWMGVGVGVLLVAFASGLAARPLAQAPLRDLAAGLTALGGGLVLFGAEAGTTAATVTALVVGAAALGSAVALRRGSHLTWGRAALELAALGAIAAAVVSALAEPISPAGVTGGLLLGAATAAAATAWVRDPARFALQLTAASAVAGAWASGSWALEVPVDTAIAVGASVAGAVTLLAAVLLRVGRPDRGWLAAGAGVGTATVVALGAIAPSTAGPSALVGLGIGLVLVGVATATAAGPLDQPGQRELGAVIVAVGGATMLVGLEVGSTAAVAVGCTVGGAAVVAGALIAYRRPTSPWVSSAIVLAVVATLGAVAVAAGALPDRSLLVPALAVAGVDAAVIGLTTRRPGFTVVAPVLLCAAWLAYATDALRGEPEWITVPVGVTILVVEGLLRAALRGRDEPMAPPEVVALDLAGMAFVVGASLVQTVSENLWYGVAAVGLGGLVTLWGAITRVRRRALFGAATVVVAVTLVVGIPLSHVALGGDGDDGITSGPGLWLVLAGIGLVAIMVAAFLEQGRRRVRAALEKLAELTSDWE